MELLLIVGLCFQFSTTVCNGATITTGPPRASLPSTTDTKPSTTAEADPCTTPTLKNIAVYEGRLNTSLYFPVDPNYVEWSVRSATDDTKWYTITGHNDTVDPSLAADYVIGPSGLIIRNATTKAENGHPISTAGLYVAYCYGAPHTQGAKFLVVREGPTCSRIQSNSSTSIDLSCSVIYADSIWEPMPAVMTWFRDGVYYTTDTPISTDLGSGVYNATSTITVDGNSSALFHCEQTFGAPTEGDFIYLARNTPEFNERCLTSADPCMSWDFKNIAVYEGDLNTLIYYPVDPNKVEWIVKPTTDDTWYTITSYNDTVDPSLAGDYAIGPSGLIIRNATTTAENGHPISTAGLYIVTCVNEPSYRDGISPGVKLLVVEEGPTCSRNPGNSSTTVDLSCSVSYADSGYNSIPAVMTWFRDGIYYTTNTIWDEYTATSIITVDSSTPAVYRCEQTFGQPNNELVYIAGNAPEFNRSCSISVSIDACTTPLNNIAVYEGVLNTLISFLAGPIKMQMTVSPTTEELINSVIINYDDKVGSLFAGDYAFSPSSLTILNATTTVENGHPISTAGLYTVQCANYPDSHGFKFLVVREGPTCSPNQSLSSAMVDLSCSVIYADSIYHPIPAVMTWSFNGARHSNDTPSRTSPDAYVYIANSTIKVNGSIPGAHQCELTFGETTERQSPYIATNAPQFKRSCVTWITL